MAQRVVEIPFGGLFDSLDVTKTPVGRCFSMENVDVSLGVLQLGLRDGVLGQRPGLVQGAPVTDKCWGAGHGIFTPNATVRLAIGDGVPTSGNLTLTDPLEGALGALAWNSTAAQVAAAYAALPGYSLGQVSAVGGPWPTLPIDVSLAGNFAGIGWGVPTFVSTLDAGTLEAQQLVVGGLSEVYLAVIQELGFDNAVLWVITSADGFLSTVWTPIAGFNGSGVAIATLTAAPWSFEQFEDKIWCSTNGVGSLVTNKSIGYGWYQIGGGFSAAPGISGVTDPGGAPTLTLEQKYPSGFPWGASSPTPVFSGFAPTDAWTTQYELTLTMTATEANVVACSVSVPLHTTTNLTRQKYWRLLIQSNDPTTSTVDPSTLVLQFQNSAGALLSPFQEDAGTTLGLATVGIYTRQEYMSEVDEAAMAAITTLVLNFQMPIMNTGDTISILLQAGDVWLNDQISTLSLINGPNKTAIQYAYSYKKFSTGEESKLSPAASIVPYLASVNGNNQPGSFTQIVAAASGSLTAADWVIGYRLDLTGIWRMVGMVPNSGTPTIDDVYMADQIDQNPAYGLNCLPGGVVPDVMGVWNGCLCFGAGPYMFISYVGSPLLFEPVPSLFSTSPYSPTDPNIPRTLFMALNRSDEVLTIVPRDSLYIAGIRGAYAMVVGGGTPDTLTPPYPLPDNAGPLGMLAACAWTGGEIIGTASGLWFYSVSAGFDGVTSAYTMDEEELTAEERGSWASLVADGGAALLVCQQDKEIWAINRFLFMHRTRPVPGHPQGEWESGSLDHPWLIALPDEVNGLIGFSELGTMLKMAPYASSAPTVWNWETGLMDLGSPRFRVLGFDLLYTGTPSISFAAFDANMTAVGQTFNLGGAENTWNQRFQQRIEGVRLQVTIAGGPADRVTRLALLVEDLPRAAWQ